LGVFPPASGTTLCVLDFGKGGEGERAFSLRGKTSITFLGLAGGKPDGDSPLEERGRTLYASTIIRRGEAVSPDTWKRKGKDKRTNKKKRGMPFNDITMESKGRRAHSPSAQRRRACSSEKKGRFSKKARPLDPLSKKRERRTFFPLECAT